MNMMQVSFLDLPAMHRELGAEFDDIWRRVTSSGQFIGGEFVERFERDWAEYCGTKYCVGVSNGTAALELSLRTLGIGPGDEVIVPANTFIATAAAVAGVGATPVFVDVDPATLLTTAQHVEAAITPRTAAVIAVHLYGQPVDMDAIRRTAAAAGIFVVEDAAQAHGATWRGTRAGGMSDIGCFSFYPGKNLGAVGDAGAIVTNDQAIAEKVRSMSNHGRLRDDPHRHQLLGGNHRLDGLQAAVLSLKLRRLDAWNAERTRIAGVYRASLTDLPIDLLEIAEAARSSHHLFVVQTEDRDGLRRQLAAASVSTGIHYPIPCHRQPAFAERRHASLPVAERAAGRVLSLPMSPNLRDAEVQYVADAVARALDRRSAGEAVFQ
jgi:dTDP-4-amino-4,6-dideoxygalactose transaminase